MGRPSGYSQELADRICSELASGRSLRSVCDDEGMPNRVTVFRWLREHEGFSSQYARAKEEAADAFADEILDIADDAKNDWMERHDPNNPGYQFNGEHVQRSKLRLEARKWIASKLKPKKYGDRLTHAGDPDAPVSVSIIDLTGKK